MYVFVFVTGKIRMRRKFRFRQTVPIPQEDVSITTFFLTTDA